jgi:hypothetical protein
MEGGREGWDGREGDEREGGREGGREERRCDWREERTAEKKKGKVQAAHAGVYYAHPQKKRTEKKKEKCKRRMLAYIIVYCAHSHTYDMYTLCVYVHTRTSSLSLGFSA